MAAIFDKLDRNGDDVLSKDEVGELLGELFHFTRRTHVNFDHEKIKIYNKVDFDVAGGEAMSKIAFINAINHKYREYWLSWEDAFTEFYKEILAETHEADNKCTSGDGDGNGNGDYVLPKKPTLKRQNSGSLIFRDECMIRLQQTMSDIAAISNDIDIHNAEMSETRKNASKENQLTMLMKDACEAVLAQYDARFKRADDKKYYQWTPRGGPLCGRVCIVRIKACIGFATYEVGREKEVAAGSLDPGLNSDGTPLRKGTKTLYRQEIDGQEYFFPAVILSYTSSDGKVGNGPSATCFTGISCEDPNSHSYLVEVVTIAHGDDLDLIAADPI